MCVTLTLHYVVTYLCKISIILLKGWLGVQVVYDLFIKGMQNEAKCFMKYFCATARETFFTKTFFLRL